jgi:hypothetical protein
VSTPETPRTWILQPDGCWWKVTSGDWSDEPHPAETIEVIEKALVDDERERLLDLLERLLSDDASTAYSAGGDADALLREYGRLGHRRPGA